MKKSLVIVAHPDDETIWMGGMLLRNRDWQSTIFSLCRASDGDRAPKFKKVCEFYGADSLIADLDDETMNPLDSHEICETIQSNLRENKFDFVFTHGENGEYGHLRHREVSRAVVKLVRDGVLNCEKLFLFSYESGNESAPLHPELNLVVPSSSFDERIVLTDSELSEKRRIVEEMYGYPREGFEVMSCNKEERFVVK